jgi:hypothetical protein
MMGRFIVGMPRAGTSALIRALTLDPRVAAFGETLFFGRNWVEPDSAGRLDRSRIESAADLIEKIELHPAGSDGLWPTITSPSTAIADAMRRPGSDLTPGELFNRLTDEVLELTGREYWVEKTPHHMMYLDRILDQLPDSRFVVMLRDPRAFMLSYKQQGDRKAAEVRKRFHRLYHPAPASLVARRTYGAALAAERMEQVLVVPLERLQSSPEEWMPRIRGHLRLPLDGPMLYPKANSSFVDGRVEHRPLSSAELTWLAWLAGPSATRAGYDLGDMPTSSIALAGSAATLPWWLLRNARFISRLDRGGLRSTIRRWVG